MNIPSLYQQAWWPLFFNTLASFVGVAFFMDAYTENFVFSPDVHGNAVYIIPAELWSFSLIVAHGGFMFGLLIEKMAGSVICLISSFLAMCIYSIFFVMATGAPYGGIVVYFSGLLFAPLYMFFMLQSFVEVWSGRNVRS